MIRAARRPSSGSWMNVVREPVGVGSRLVQLVAARPWSLLRAVEALRWAALAILLVFNLFVPPAPGWIPHTSYAIAVLALYNLGVAVFRRRLERWLSPVSLLAVEAMLVSLGVLATGGLHSPLFVLYYLLIIGSAFYLPILENVAFTLLLAITYVGVYVGSALQPLDPSELQRLATRLTLLLIVATASGVLARQLREERQATEHERALVARLSLINDLLRMSARAHSDVRQVMATALSSASQAIGADVGMVALLPRADVEGEQIVERGFGFPATQPEGPRRLALALATLLDEVETPLVWDRLPTRLEDPSRALAALWEATQLCAIAAAPLRLGDEPIGVLCLGTRRAGGFSPADVEFFGTIAQHAALALWNARLYATEQENVERLRQLERMKSDFLSAVSHDFKTPLTSIMASVGLLLTTLRGERLATTVRLGENIERNVERLDGLVSDLLDMARLQSGRVTVQREPVQIEAVLDDAAAAVRPLLAAREQRLVRRIPPGLPAVLGDRRRLEQMAVNLLSNANKYGPRRGEIVIEAASLAGEVRVAVSDQGPGVPPGERVRIFEQFFRGDGPAIRRRGGTGLGLAIARSLVELHGGRIGVDDGPGGRGSTFYFSLPVRPAGAAEGPPDRDRGRGSMDGEGGVARRVRHPHVLAE